MNVASRRAQIERMYSDRCTVSRPTKSKDPVSKETKLILQPVYEDQPCRLSQQQLGKNEQTEAENRIRYESKLFIAPELVILQGDEIVVTRAGRTWSYTAGEPFPPYSTHQEISLQRRSNA